MERGVWRTIKGRHVYIKDKSEIENWKKDKEKEIKENRDFTYNIIKNANEGYQEQDRLYGIYRSARIKERYDYGKAKYVLDSPLTQEEKKYFNYKESNGVQCNEKWEEERNSFQSKIAASGYAEGKKNGNEREYEYRLKNTGLTASKAEDLRYKSQNALGGNWKPDSERANKVKALEAEMKSTYEKNPINVDTSKAKYFNNRIMDPALQNLQRLSDERQEAMKVTGPYGYEAIKNWEPVKNPKTAREEYMNDLKADMNNIDSNFYHTLPRQKVIYDDPNFLVTAYQTGDDRYYIEKYRGNRYVGWGEPNVDIHNSWTTTDLKNVKAEASWPSGGSDNLEDTKKQLEKINKVVSIAEDFNKNHYTGKIYEKPKYKLKSNTQLVKSLIERGYTPETAEKMAQEMIKRRKRK